MKPTLMLTAALLVASAAGAGDVYMTRDANGNPIYTDTPQSIPAEKLKVNSASTDAAEVQSRYEQQMKQYAADDQAESRAAAAAAESKKAAAMNADDRAKRCTEARQRYDAVMQSHRLYEQSPDGERRYLDSTEIDAVRADAKKVMDEYCGSQ